MGKSVWTLKFGFIYPETPRECSNLWTLDHELTHPDDPGYNPIPHSDYHEPNNVLNCLALNHELTHSDAQDRVKLFGP